MPASEDQVGIGTKAKMAPFLAVQPAITRDQRPSMADQTALAFPAVTDASPAVEASCGHPPVLGARKLCLQMQLSSDATQRHSARRYAASRLGKDSQSEMTKLSAIKLKFLPVIGRYTF